MKQYLIIVLLGIILCVIGFGGYNYKNFVNKKPQIECIYKAQVACVEGYLVVQLYLKDQLMSEGIIMVPKKDGKLYPIKCEDQKEKGI